MAAVKSGTAPLIIPVTLEETCCCAIGKSVRGKAIQVTPRSTIRGQSARSIDVPERWANDTVAKPKRSRRKVIKPGAKASTPSAMNRNDAPQVTPVKSSSPHSEGPNAPLEVPSAVDMRRRLFMGSKCRTPGRVV